MTIEERLSAIEARRNQAIGTEGDPISVLDIIVKDVPWLIAEVRRLQAACAKGKAIIRDIADGSEYARGREEAVKAIRDRAADYQAMYSPTRSFPCCYHEGDIADKLDSLADAIERGEHVAEGKDG